MVAVLRPWVWGTTMERTPAILGLGSGSRLLSISRKRVRSEGLQNLTLSTVIVPCPCLALPTPFGPVATLYLFFNTSPVIESRSRLYLYVYVIYWNEAKRCCA